MEGRGQGLVDTLSEQRRRQRDRMRQWAILIGVPFLSSACAVVLVLWVAGLIPPPPRTPVVVPVPTATTVPTATPVRGIIGALAGVLAPPTTAPARAAATAVPIAIPTAVPAATATPLPPTATPIPPTPRPTVTPVVDTPPGTILKFGEAWRQDGIEATVHQPKWEGDYCKTLMKFHINTENQTAGDLIAKVNSGDWFSIDDRGIKRKIVVPWGASWPGSPNDNHHWCGSWDTQILKPGKISIPLAVAGELKDLPNIQWLQVVIPELSRAKSATWQIDVPH